MVAPSNSVAEIAIDLIDVPLGRRRLDPAWVETLAGLMTTTGRQSPIEVLVQGERYRLIFGGHRLAAAKFNGWSTIRADVKDAAAFANEAEIRLREITENLARRELSVLDRAVDIARWREIYEAARGTVRRGRPSKLGQIDPISDEAIERFAGSFSTAANRALGIEANAIKRALRIASIPADLRDRIALHAIADNQSELLSLAAETADRQAAIVDLLTDGEPPRAGTVTEAIAIIDHVAKTEPARWEKLSDAFSRLKEREQDRFFELHQAAIMRWMNARGQA